MSSFSHRVSSDQHQCHVMLINLCAVDPVVWIKSHWPSLHVFTTNLKMIQMSLMAMMSWHDTPPRGSHVDHDSYDGDYHDNDDKTNPKKITLAHTTQSRQPWWKVTPPTVSESVGESGWLQLGNRKWWWWWQWWQDDLDVDETCCRLHTPPIQVPDTVESINRWICTMIKTTMIIIISLSTPTTPSPAP